LINSIKIGIAFSRDAKILFNTIINCSHGIATRGVSNISIKNNIIKENSGYGIYLGTQITDFGSINITIENNMITYNYIGISRYYGCQSIKDVKVRSNIIANNSFFDILADFPGLFESNIITSKDKLVIVDAGFLVVGNVDIHGKLIKICDLNEDLQVNIRDLALLGFFFGKNEQDDEWNVEIDLVRDGIINLKDFAFFAKHFYIENEL